MYVSYHNTLPPETLLLLSGVILAPMLLLAAIFGIRNLRRNLRIKRYLKACNIVAGSLSDAIALGLSKHLLQTSHVNGSTLLFTKDLTILASYDEDEKPPFSC